MSNIDGKSVLITGGNGFIGSHLARKLVGLGCSVTVLGAPFSSSWQITDIDNQVKSVTEDISQMDVNELAARLSNTQIIYHLAASGVKPSGDDASSVIQTNVVGTNKMLQLALKLNTERFIYTGSCFEYGEGDQMTEDSMPMPLSEYGASKSAAWLLAHAFSRRYGLDVVSIRPFNVYGPFEAGYRLIPYTIIQALDGLQINLTNGEQRRDFVFVEDIVDAFIAAAIVPDAAGKTFNACTGIATSIKTVATLIVKLIDSSSLLDFGSLPDRDTETKILSGDPSKAREILGWTAATPLTSGLEKTIQWFREFRYKYSDYSKTT